MAELLRCVDRWYREIVLYEDTWYDKIMAQRPILAPHLGRIEGILRNPDVVTFDIDHPGGENFYRLAALPSPLDRSYFKICVRFRATQDETVVGVIVTAFPTFRIKRGETIRWRK
jgi:hypothetical protein